MGYGKDEGRGVVYGIGARGVMWDMAYGHAA